MSISMNKYSFRYTKMTCSHSFRRVYRCYCCINHSSTCYCYWIGDERCCCRWSWQLLRSGGDVCQLLPQWTASSPSQAEHALVLQIFVNIFYPERCYTHRLKLHCFKFMKFDLNSIVKFDFSENLIFDWQLICIYSYHYR